MFNTIAGITIPDSKMARELTQLIRDTEPDLLFLHSTRVYLFGALTGQRKGLKYYPELLYVGPMFHDIGLTDAYRDSPLKGVQPRWCSSAVAPECRLVRSPGYFDTVDP